MNSSTFKNVHIADVRQAAETYILNKGLVTTLEVKKYLRKRGFWAIQQTISEYMDIIAYELDWCFTCNGQYRTYFLNQETEEIFETYLTRQDYYWGIYVKGKQQFVYHGQKGFKGSLERYDCTTNAQAVAHARNWANYKTDAGFQVQSSSKSPALGLLAEYARFEELNPVSCTFSYFGVEQSSLQNVRFWLKNNRTLLGQLFIQQQTGYEFRWDLPKDYSKVQHALTAKSWNALKLGYASQFLLGQKLISQQTMALDGESISDYQNIEVLDATEEIGQILVLSKNLYKAEITFDNGETVQLKKAELDINRAFFPLLYWLLG